MRRPESGTRASDSPPPARPRAGSRKPWQLFRLLLVWLLLAEVLLRAGFSIGARLGLFRTCGIRPELLGRLAQVYSGYRPSPEAVETGIVPDRDRGYRLRPDVHQQEIRGTLASTNSRGIRGTREYAVPKSPSVIRLVALGDSMTFGDGVPDDATWPAQLESALPHTEVANLGVPAYAHDQMYFALRNDGMALQPDAVVLGFYRDDLQRNELTFYCAEKPRFSRGPGGWQVDNVPVPLPSDAHDYYLWLPLVYAVPRVLFEAAVKPALHQDSEERATEILRRMRQLTDAAGARFIIVNLPDNPEAPPNPHGFFYDYCAGTGAECVDTWPQFHVDATGDESELGARYQRPNDPHYSRAGYAIVADALRKHFTQHPIVRATGRDTTPQG